MEENCLGIAKHSPFAGFSTWPCKTWKQEERFLGENPETEAGGTWCQRIAERRGTADGVCTAVLMEGKRP